MWLVGFLEKSRIGQQSQRHGAVPVIQPANGEIFRTLLIFEEFKKFYGFDGFVFWLVSTEDLVVLTNRCVLSHPHRRVMVSTGICMERFG